MPRWASIDRGPYQPHPFGAEIHREASFGVWVPETLHTSCDLLILVE
jgi:hypothetical protein